MFPMMIYTKCIWKLQVIITQILQKLNKNVDFFTICVILDVRKTSVQAESLLMLGDTVTNFWRLFMKKKKFFSLLLAGVLAVSSVTAVSASTEDEIAYVREQKAAAESGLAQAEASISSLEGKKQELENYLAELDAQYNELTNSVAELEAEAAAKEEELKQVQAELEKAKETARKQYEAMKIRIVYMYENGGSSMLEMLLSARNLSEFLNQAENVSQISQYDRDMLKKYEEVQNNIKAQEDQVEEESQAIEELKSQKVAKQQEVQDMAANTSASITSYVNEISATRAEAGALMAEINNADNSISSLLAQAEAEKAAAAAEAEREAAAEVSSEGEGYSDFDPEADTMDSSDSSTSSTSIVEEELYGSTDGTYEDETYAEDTYEEDNGSMETTESTEDTSGSSGQGTYLGNFRLTGYCNCAQCCGTAGNATASGTTPVAGHTVAMAGVPFGTQLLINGTVYTVEDLGTPYGHVDIFFDSHEDALNFGSQYADVYQLN